jgi:hypothetical protein
VADMNGIKRAAEKADAFHKVELITRAPLLPDSIRNRQQHRLMPLNRSSAART